MCRRLGICTGYPLDLHGLYFGPSSRADDLIERARREHQNHEDESAAQSFTR